MLFVRGDTALIQVVINDKIEIVKLLLNAGADVNKQNIGGSTALIFGSLFDNI